MTGIPHRGTSTAQFSSSSATADQPRTVVAAGEIDLANVEQFHSALSEAVATSEGALTVDLTGVTYCDSTAVRALFAVVDATDLTLVIPSTGPIGTLLRITGIDQVATVITSDRKRV